VPGAAFVFEPPKIDDLKASVIHELKHLHLDIDILQPWLRLGCQAAHNFYSHHPMDLRTLIATCTAILFYIDDFLSQSPEELQNLQLYILGGQVHSNPFLQCLLRSILPRMWDYFHPLSASCIAIGVYDFMIGNSMEAIARNADLSPHAKVFPEYMRLKSGVPAPYAYMIFPKASHPDIDSYIQSIPELLTIINNTNDILSFYKEEAAFERENYVHMRAQVYGKEILHTLQEISDETIKSIQNVINMLENEPRSRDAFCGFLHGYLQFHLTDVRYHLKELYTVR
jgi:hypothetical protein